jgi:hypothetical protein
MVIAIKLYKEVPGIRIYRHTFDPLDIARFRENESGNCGTDPDRVKRAGGKLPKCRTLISDDIDYFGLLADTKENRIAISLWK